MTGVTPEAAARREAQALRRPRPRIILALPFADGIAFRGAPDAPAPDNKDAPNRLHGAYINDDGDAI